ncbi:hypothetical protein BGZ89_012058 [Linnemannia elongata]|nr:hypothetical protein BGZ89_012058 [Linnemannia elongata]
MKPAAQRLFAIPELVATLTTYLNRKEISRLMQTSRQLQELCTPAHYRRIPATYQPGKNNILRNVEPILALSKNVHHVRELDLRLVDLIYYVNCILVYQDRIAETAEQPPSRPLWLAPPDPHLCPILPIPPMSLLTKIDIDIERTLTYESLEACPYSLPSYHDPRATSTQVCWILQLSSHLQWVVLKGFNFKDDRDVVLFTTSIFGLERLQELSLSASYWTSVEHPLAPTVFFSCPHSLQSLDIDLYEYYDQDGEYEDDYGVLDPGESRIWEKTDKECGLTTTPRRQEPLVHLKNLDMRAVEEDVSETDLLSMLQHCPNLCDLGLPRMEEIIDSSNLATAIAESCSALSEVTFKKYGEGMADGTLTLQIMDRLPSQQVKRYHCDDVSFIIPGLDAGSLFRRHSSTLQRLSLGGCDNFDSKAIQVFLVECRALEVLEMRRVGQSGHRITLEDAIEFPWSCTRMRQLMLTVGVPEAPLHRHSGVKPYFLRPAPIILSTAEKEQFTQLETFYRHIGMLKDVERLDLGAVFLDSDGQALPIADVGFYTFPGILSLGDSTIGRPGYLHHLAGLKRLRVLLGSVSALTDEAMVTVGRAETAWMHENWPALRKAAFVPPLFRDIPVAFKWLQAQRKKAKTALVMCGAS